MQQKKLKSMRVNLTSLQTEIWDQYNLIEMKVKKLTKPNSWPIQC